MREHDEVMRPQGPGQRIDAEGLAVERRCGRREGASQRDAGARPERRQAGDVALELEGVGHAPSHDGTGIAADARRDSLLRSPISGREEGLKVRWSHPDRPSDP